MLDIVKTPTAYIPVTLIATYDDLHVDVRDPNFRFSAFRNFLAGESMHPNILKEGVSGLVMFASIDGEKNSGAIYHFHEPTRSVWLLTPDVDDATGRFRTGTDLSCAEFEELYDKLSLQHLISCNGIPTARIAPKEDELEIVPFAA